MNATAQKTAHTLDQARVVLNFAEPDAKFRILLTSQQTQGISDLGILKERQAPSMTLYPLPYSLFDPSKIARESPLGSGWWNAQPGWALGAKTSDRLRAELHYDWTAVRLEHDSFLAPLKL
jgi:hypothetical protein